MKSSHPATVVDELFDAINRGDLQAAISKYETEACFVVRPRQIVSGTKALHEAIGGMIAHRPVLTVDTQQTIEIEGLALYCSKWRLTGTAADGTPIQMSGASSDVLRRQADGSWRIVIDNPWGPSILG